MTFKDSVQVPLHVLPGLNSRRDPVAGSRALPPARHYFKHWALHPNHIRRDQTTQQQREYYAQAPAGETCEFAERAEMPTQLQRGRMSTTIKSSNNPTVEILWQII
jgi:hypothetical protein